MRVFRSGYNEAAAGPRRGDFPDNFVGDLVKTTRGWVVARGGRAHHGTTPASQ
jgi:hypothetical protein